MLRFLSCLLLIVIACSDSFAEEKLLDLTSPTEIRILQSALDLKVELSSINSECSYGFLEEGLRGFIDCPGVFPPYSKTLPVLQNNFVKQIRIGTHKDKLRIVLDLYVPLPVSSNISKIKNTFILAVESSKKELSEPPGKPIVYKTINTTEPKVEVTLAPTSTPTPQPTSTDSPKELPTVTPSPEIVLPTPEATPIEQESMVSGVGGGSLPLSIEFLQISFNEGERLIKDISVSNSSDSQLTVVVDTYPDLLGSENLVEGISADRPLGTLTPSPRRFTLGAGQRRTVRFILTLNDSLVKIDKEASFIARFSDPEGELLAPKVNFDYIPRRLLPNLVSMPIDNGIKLTNSGSAGVELSSGRCCRLDDCQAVDVTYLAAGQSVTLDIPEDCQLEFIRKHKGSYQRFKVSREIINDASR